MSIFDAGTHSDAVTMRFEDFARVVKPVVGDIGRARREDVEH